MYDLSQTVDAVWVDVYDLRDSLLLVLCGDMCTN